MPRPVHFEIHAGDVPRARAFYGAAFGWTFEDWSEYAGTPYLGVRTGEEQPGIDGAIMQRRGDAPAAGQAVIGAVLTIGVEDYASTEAAILAAGGTVALARHALPGMAWQGYYLDTEGNVFGIHQPDEQAR
jgi:uncharacterized protein